MVRLEARSLPRRGGVALGACTLALVAGAAPARGAQGIYAGTGTRAPIGIVLATDPAGTTVRSITYFARARCREKGLPLWGRLAARTADPGFDAPSGLVMTRNARGAFRGTLEETVTSAPDTITYTVTFAGRLTRTSGRGTLAIRGSVRDASGAEIDTCTLAATPWGASRGAGRIYGGITTQGMPIGLRVDARGRRVVDFITGWAADCTSGGWLNAIDWLTNFTLSSRRTFQGAFRTSDTLSDGGRWDFAYELGGTLGRTAGHGRFRLTATERDSAGTSVDTCTTGRLTWRAASG